MDISIIGTGKIARGISFSLLGAGHNVSLVEHTPGKGQVLAEELRSKGTSGSISVAAAGTLPGEIVFLAVPYTALQSVVQQFIELLPGKILVDVTNPINFQKMELLVQDGSAAEEIANMIPASTRVVKAYNTVFGSNLVNPRMECGPIDIFIAGDDADAKAIITRLVEDSGLHPVDVGPLNRARQLEAMEFLHMAIQSTSHLGYKSIIKIIP